jgi:CHAD domain-containing protein
MTPQPEQLPTDSATIMERSKSVFFAQWEELLRLRRAALKTSDLEDIHDLRVASRRFRAALQLFEPVAPKVSLTGLKRSVRRLTRTLGGLRNIDEALLFFQTRHQTVPAADNLRNILARLRSRELKQIQKALIAFDYRTFDRMVREMVAGLTEDCSKEPGGGSLLAYFSDTSLRRYQPIQQLIPVSAVPENRASRHALRIALKKWRYFLEIIALVLERDYTPLLELLKEYQSVLGRMNDIVEFELLIGTFELPAAEREVVEAALRAEDAVLLENFSELIDRTPLSYTFLI